MTTPTPKPHWFHLTPARFFLGLLVVQVFLLLSEQFQWFPFNEKKGWTVLIAVGVVCVAVLVMLLWGLVCLCLRRRFQFGVRSLLVFFVALSVPMGWFAWEMEKARRQREVVEAIEEGGGNVSFDYEIDENGVWIRGAEATTPSWLRRLLGGDFFCEVEWVGYDRHAFHGNTLRYLEELTKLKKLWLDGTQINNSDLVHLEKMPQLVFLSLDNTFISDDGLKRLKGMSKLDTLTISNNAITDSGLEHLHGMHQLRTLWIGDTQVTADGVEKLQQALPSCEITEFSIHHD